MRMAMSAVLLGMVVLSGVGIVGCGQTSAIQQGTEALQKGDYDLAISWATEAIRLDPEESMPVALRAEAYLMKRDHLKTEADSARATQLGLPLQRKAPEK